MTDISISKTQYSSNVLYGEFDDARIPNLDASKITTGTLGVAQIPSLSASKIASDTLEVDRIPNLNASKITAGTLPSTRLDNIETGHCIHYSGKIMVQMNYNNNRIGLLLIKEKNNTKTSYYFAWLRTHNAVATTVVYGVLSDGIAWSAYGYNATGSFGPQFSVVGYSSSKVYKYAIFWQDNT